MIDCLTNLIGLSDIECTCFDGQKPEDFDTVNVSESGLYITDGGIDLLQSIFESIDCRGTENVYSQLQTIREKAIKAIEIDLPATLLKTRSETIFPFSGQIGRRNFNNSRSVGSGLAGVQLRPQPIRDATFTLTKIHAGFLASSTFDLTVSSNDPDFVTQTISITNTGGQFTAITLDTPLVLPFYVEGIEHLNYVFSYAAEGVKPLVNTFYCCSTRYPWMKHLSAGGFQAASINYNNDYTSTQCNGLILEGFISCDNMAWVCTLDEQGGSAIKNILASALVQKSTELLAEFILNSGNIGYYTILNREGLYGKRNKARSEYATNINWIASNLPANVTDCYSCKPMAMRRTSL